MQIGIKKSESFELQALKSNPSLMPLLKEGDLIEVTLFENAGRAAYFNVPRVGVGLIYGLELSNAKQILKKLNVGDSVTARIVDPENENGFVELSLSEAGKQKAWQEVKDLKDKDEPINIKVTNANSGGLIADIMGLQAFLPSSQLSNENYPQEASSDRSKIVEALKEFIGKELSVKIININPRTNKLIVSEREAKTENIKELLTKYSADDTIDGIISGVATFGAFIRFADNPEVEGLIHISELDHRLIDNPKEVVKVGDMVKAKIVEIKEGKVSLSLKALQPDPWQNVEEKFKEGIIVKGVVHKLTPFGSFIKLNEDIVGLIHVSEFGSLEELKKQLEPGSTHKFVIDSVKPADKRIVLKLEGAKKPKASKEPLTEPTPSKEASE